MGALEGKRVFITGAGAGVGAGLAQACAAAGAHVIATSRGSNGREVADAITAAGGSAEWMPCDVSSRQSIDDAIGITVSSGGLDSLIHNSVSRLSSVPVRLEDLDEATLEEGA